MDFVLLRRARKMVPPVAAGGGEARSPGEIAALQRNLGRLGFVLSASLANAVTQLDPVRFRDFHDRLVEQLREMTGDHRPLGAMYMDFPRRVVEASEAELYLNALYHYLTLDMPDRKATQRPPLLERTDVRVIDVGTVEEREQILTHLCSAKTSLSPADRDDVARYVEQLGNRVVDLLPAEIPIRENVAVIGVLLLRHTTLGEEFLRKHVKRATDVLRVAVAWSDGDVSLAEPTKFGGTPRPVRRLLLELLDPLPDLIGEMRRWPKRWVRLGERLHPGEFKQRYPAAHAAFTAIRNNTPYDGLNTRIEALVEHGDVEGLMDILRSEPGMFARRLDHLLRLSDAPTRVIESFKHVAKDCPTTLLLRMASHFDFRERQRVIEATPFEPAPSLEQPPPSGLSRVIRSLINVEGPEPPAAPLQVTVPNELIRVFFPKGEVAKVYATPKPLPLLPPGVAAAAAETCRSALREILSRKQPLGNCWVDPELSKYRVPTAQRSAAKALRTVSRGTRLPLPDASTIRLFIWWMNGQDRTDLDLSAAFYDEHFRYIDVVSYYNLKNFGGHHSGDIVDAPNGAAEFIDLDLAQTAAKGVRYVMMVLTSYTRQPYCDLPECFAGWMGREQPNSGEIFEARTVQQKFDIASDTRFCLPAIVDLEEQEVIWCDLALRASAAFNNVRNNLRGVSLMVRAMRAINTPTLADLFTLHAEARGRLVATREEADTVFSVEDGDITVYDGPRVNAEFL